VQTASTIAAALAATLTLASATALATSGGVPTDGGDGGGGEQGGGTSDVRLRLADTTPGKIFLAGSRTAKFSFKIKGAETVDLEVRALAVETGKTIRSWKLDAVKPGRRQTVSWNGKRPGGSVTAAGKHVFRVYDSRGLPADASGSRGSPRFGVYSHKFPLRGAHSYGDGLGAGRGHRGQDLFARCGRRIVAASGGLVRWRRFQGGGAGYYVVIESGTSGKDYVYMHLARRGRPREGTHVETGQRIGFNGRSGNASDCHLHFELWSAPGWYDGGKVANPTKPLRRWDSWS
jgi:murein DD-endopeptidase MepM/ murein hydrolase activator NlpD